MTNRPLQKGFSLIEVLIALALGALVLMVAVPAFAAYRRHAAVRIASTELRSIFHLARMRAIARSANCGVKFSVARNGRWTWSIYDDGDNDGVLNDDIARGTDRRVSGPFEILSRGIARIGLPPVAVTNPDGDVMKAGSSPVVFGTSTICSFSQLGSATPGSIYFTDDAAELYVVRVFAPTAKIRTLRYNGGSKKWESR